MRNWLFIIGAGASLAAPARLPAFAEMAEGVLTAIGWTPIKEGRWVERWVHERYPPFEAPAMAPEVLFGTLRSFGIEFAEPVTAALERTEPNAAHRIAAQVLRHGGCVWTPNVDRDVESACNELNLNPPRTGVAAARFPDVLAPLNATSGGTLVKFHGTVEEPNSLAFTDRELLVPLSDTDVAHLVNVATDRDVVLYGYAGADADLAELLEQTFKVARTVRWYEPSIGTRTTIALAFPTAKLTFDPPTLAADWPAAVTLTGEALVAAARRDGAELADSAVSEFLAVGEPPPAPSLQIRQPAGVTHARLVERFGAPEAEADAYRVARAEDLKRHRVGALKGHLRWGIGRSLYQEGAVAKIVALGGRHRSALIKVPTRRLRDYVITRNCALLLQRGHWEDLLDFSDWAVAARSTEGGKRFPSDLYYRSQGYRYAFRPDLAGIDARQAVDALASALDPERLAGALYEAGSAALYTADFDMALSYSFQLRYRRGRYAIPRWQAWGAWLEATTCAYQLRPTDSAEPIDTGRVRFQAEKRRGPLADMRTAELLNARVKLAQTGQFDRDLLVCPEDDQQTGRYKNDLDLILADLYLALGDAQEASRRLSAVHASPSNLVAQAHARLGLAELRRLDGDNAGAADEFYAQERYAKEHGATWLRLQVLLGLALCHDPRYETIWQEFTDDYPAAAGRAAVDYAVGDPRVLWLLTV